MLKNPLDNLSPEELSKIIKDGRNAPKHTLKYLRAVVAEEVEVVRHLNHPSTELTFQQYGQLHFPDHG